MTPERRAVVLLLGLAVAGQGLRVLAGKPGAPPGEVQLLSGGPAGVPRSHRDSSVAVGKPLGADERIDLDRASAQEIARLPRVGLTMARNIVADRDAHGPFGSLAGLDRVSGVGPGLLAAIGTHVSFSAIASATPRTDSIGSGYGGVAVNLNSATAVELERLPFIGAYMAAQIVAFRQKHGPFPAVDSLVRVPGIGPATLLRVRDHLRVN
jgi:competence ComEA-like helix-hairpin-helix protein